jgi:hypothetical protein
MGPFVIAAAGRARPSHAQAAGGVLRWWTTCILYCAATLFLLISCGAAPAAASATMPHQQPQQPQQQNHYPHRQSSLPLVGTSNTSGPTAAGGPRGRAQQEIAASRQQRGAGQSAEVGVALHLTTSVLQAVLATHAGGGDDMLAAELLAEGRLAELLAAPSVAAAATQALRGWRCTRLVETQEPSTAAAPDTTVPDSIVQAGKLLVSTANPRHSDRVSQRQLQFGNSSQAAFPASPVTGSRRIAMAGAPSVDEGVALLAAVVPDPRTEKAWAALRGWTPESQPCKPPGWSGVNCSAGRVTQVLLQNLPDLGLHLGRIEELRWLPELVLFAITGTRISGTIPPSLGNLPQVQQLGLDNNPSLSGTIPPSLGNLSQAQLLYLYNNPSLSGTIPPSLGNLSQAQQLFLNSNPSLSGTIPPSLGNLSQAQRLYLYNNPSLSGTIPPSLGNLPQAQVLYLYSNPSLSGTIPSMSNCAALRVLNVGNSSLSTLPGALPRSLTHLYLARNPIVAHAADLRTLLNATPTLHSLEVAFTNAHIALDTHGGTDTGSFGTVVTNPSPCRVGGMCAFTLQLVDEFGQPVRQGGLIANLSLRLNGSHAAPMRDNRDGTFTAPIDPSWIAHTGRFEFHFEHAGAEFWPQSNTPTTAAVASDCHNPPDPSDRCAGLRSVTFEPRACPDGSHTVADAATGAICECMPGFAPDPGRGGSVRSCHRLCETGTKATASNDGCECDGTSYNATATGTLLCVASQVGSPQPLLSHAAARVGRDCRPCPDECATCAHGVATLRAGWRLNAPTVAALRSQLGGAGTVHGGARVQLAFLCPYASSHAMGPGDTGPDCPSLELRAPTTANSSDRNSILACRDNHTGVLCALCRPGFSRKGSSDNRCVACADGKPLGMPPNLFAGLCAALLAALFAMIWATRRHLKALKTELATNLRILLGAGQVLSLLSDVLDLVYPKQAMAGMSLVSLAVADVGSLISFDCRGFSWFDRWRLLVGIVPGVAAAVIFLRFLYARRRHEQGPAVAKTVARQQAFGHLSFVVMLLYPQVSTRVLAALRCRQLGPDVSVLQADYSISCLGNTRYGHYQLVAILMVCAWVVGVPLALLGMLLHQRRVSYRRWFASDTDNAFDRAQATHSTSGDEGQSHSALLAAAGDSLAVYNYSRVRQSFGFCVDDFKPDCYWYEPVDMLRKLALSGLLQFLKPGTGAQVLGGCVIAFASFGLQLYHLGVTSFPGTLP